MYRAPFLAAAAAVVLAVPLSAQEAPAPGAVVLRYWQCENDVLSDLREFSQGEGLSIMQRLVDDGVILGWGQLQHSWGDEWNWVDYFVVESTAAFFDAWPTIVAAFGDVSDDIMDRFQEGCDAHKDNIYGIVAQTADPDAGS